MTFRDVLCGYPHRIPVEGVRQAVTRQRIAQRKIANFFPARVSTTCGARLMLSCPPATTYQHRRRNLLGREGCGARPEPQT